MFVSVVSAGVLLILLLAPGTALAHERRTIGSGKYDVVVGWNVEPAYVGQMNAASIRIMNAGTTTPVTGADKSLKLAIRQGASTQAFPLKAAFGQDGFYTADINPTRVGDYQWIFTGDINGDAVNETFDTADGKFNAVQTGDRRAVPGADRRPGTECRRGPVGAGRRAERPHAGADRDRGGRRRRAGRRWRVAHASEGSGRTCSEHAARERTSLT